MRILAIGLDYHRADVRLREQFAVPSSDLDDTLVSMREQFAEGVLLSTCNRTELYALVGHERSGRKAAIDFLARSCGVAPREFEDALFEHWQEGAVRHLFRVAAGLESMIVGEHQILGQVRAASDAARQVGSSGPLMTRLFRDAVGFGKRARVESGIARNAVSVSTAAVQLAREAIAGLAGRTALVVGAGKMGSLAARNLASRNVAQILVASRTLARADELAERVGGRSFGLDELPGALAQSDIVIASTAAPGYVITEPLVRAALAGREDRPLVLVDIAVPRDVEPEVAELPGCTLHNIDDLIAVQQANLAARRLEALKVEGAIEREIERFMEWWQAREVAPTIADLLAHAEEIRLAEVERGIGRLGDLSERERNAINAMTSAIIKKMLHRPIVQLKERGGYHDARVYVHAVRELFGLPPVDEGQAVER